MKERER